MKEAFATQILLRFFPGHHVVFIDGVSLKSEGGTWGGSLVSVTVLIVILHLYYIMTTPPNTDLISLCV